MPELAGKTILVTGGSQGIGLGIAQAFAIEGANVHITGTRANVSAYEDDLGSYIYHQADLSASEGCRALFSSLSEIDVLVNNARIGSPSQFEMEEFRRVFEVNLFSIMELSMLYKRVLMERRGSIVNIGSVASHLAIKKEPAYTASKSAVFGLTRALADKWASSGLRVNMVAPGFVTTRMTEWIHSNEDRKVKFESVIPMRRFGTPLEIGHAAVFLASDKSSYITGISLPVEGGIMLR